MLSDRARRTALKYFALFVSSLAFWNCAGRDSTGPDTPPDATYSIEIRYYGSEPSRDVRAALLAAAERIQAMITADLPATQLSNFNLAPDSVCGVPVTVNEIIDDLVIYATVKTIDGVGKVQASAGPCLVRSSGKLPVLGKMEMDVADMNALANTGLNAFANTARLNAVVLHEMLHVVGFGTIWGDVTPVRISGAGGADPRFNGAQSIQGCNSAGGTSVCGSGVPVENCTGIANCGSGTRDAHWRELTFRTELMTGFIEAQNVPMALSAMSIQSLGDLGYAIGTGAADPYQIPGTALREADETSSVGETVMWERIRRPRLEVTQGGAVGAFVRR